MKLFASVVLVLFLIVSKFSLSFLGLSSLLGPSLGFWRLALPVGGLQTGM